MILTSRKFCSILTDIRDAYEKRDKNLSKCKKRVFINLDHVLVNFHVAAEKQDDGTLKMYQGRIDEILGAIDTVPELQEYFDWYILVTASWDIPSVRQIRESGLHTPLAACLKSVSS